MKVAFLLSSLVVGSSTAFAPTSTSSSRTTSALSATAELDGMIGTGPETGNAIFDPLELAKWAPVEHLRKAELANGRSAMLATVGWVFPKVVGTFEGPVSTDPVKAFLESDAQWWAQFVLFCGVIESIKLRGEMEGKSYTGDINKKAVVDWSANWSGLDKKKKEEMVLSELKNGRLAMIGIAGFASNYFLPGSVPGLGGFGF